MTASNFDKSLAMTLVYEGGWVDNPADPGGATMCGITQAVYDEDRDRRHLPRQSVRLSTVAERAGIYRWRYWYQAQCDALPSGVDYAVFDFAVNSGVSRAVKTLQGIVGVEQDGNAGRYTLAAVQAYCQQYTAEALTDLICHRRVMFLQSLPTFATFGNGWMARVMGPNHDPQKDDEGVIERAFDMARGADVSPIAAPIVTPKTYNITSLAHVVGSVES